MCMCKEFNVGETLRIGDTEYIVAHIDEIRKVMHLMGKYCEWTISSRTELTELMVRDYCERWLHEKIPMFAMPLLCTSDAYYERSDLIVTIPNDYNVTGGIKWDYFKDDESYMYREKNGRLHSFLVDTFDFSFPYMTSLMYTESDVYPDEAIDENVGFRPHITIRLSEPHVLEGKEKIRWDLLNQLAKDKAL